MFQNSDEKFAEHAEKEDNMFHLRKSCSFRRTIKDMIVEDVNLTMYVDDHQMYIKGNMNEDW